MNILTTFLIVAILLIGKTYSMSVETTEDHSVGNDLQTTETTITTTTVTATTTTLPVEIDREWEDLVLAGPAVVKYLHLFMVLVSSEDKRLLIPDQYSVDYINNINSLRDTLLQISSAMKTTFKLARDDLIRVRGSMSQIPEHMKAGLLLIQSAPKTLLTQLLPYTLRNIDRAANEGSTVSKPTVDQFISVEHLIDELVTLIKHTSLSDGNTHYLIEANIYANDMKTQWNLLVKLFRKFSERADTTQTSINDRFIEPIEETQKADGFNSQSQRTGSLGKLNSATIFIDQSSYLLHRMVHTYTDISNDYMVNQTTSGNAYLNLGTELERITSQRELWQHMVSQSVKIARLAQERHDQFVATGPNREAEYATYLQSIIAT